jgi:type II secretory pathway component PulK
MNDRGFALIAALWVITVLSSVVGLGVASVRHGQRVTQNRLVLTRGRWAAEACFAIAEARSRTGRLGDTTTVDLGRTVRCRWRVNDPAARLNAVVASRAQLSSLFRAIGMVPDSAERLARGVAALAKAGQFWDLNRIRHLPGFDARVLDYLTVDGTGQVNLGIAPAPVLAALPGLNGEAVRELLANRRYGTPVGSLDDLSEALSPSARAVLDERRRELTPMVSFSSRPLVIRVEGWVAAFGEYPRATLELLVVPLPERLAVLRRRMS